MLSSDKQRLEREKGVLGREEWKWCIGDGV